MILSYIIRATICSLYIIVVTKEGFIEDPEIWNYGLEIVSRFQIGFSWVTIIIAVIIIVFFFHDYYISKEKPAKTPALRFISGCMLAAIMIIILLNSVVGVRDNLLLVVDSAMLKEIQQTTPSLELLQKLKTWPLGVPQIFGAIFSQILAIAVAVYVKVITDKVLHTLQKQKSHL